MCARVGKKNNWWYSNLKYMKYHKDDIYTSQGTLAEVENKPNLDILMNVFNIPRAFGVSGFTRNWNVGMHSMATAFIALYWAKFNNFNITKRDKFVSQAFLHDIHEAVTGDILPHFKSKTVKKQLDSIQHNLLHALGTEEDESLKTDLKIVDLIAFLYEIKQVSPSILNSKKMNLANTIAEKQKEILFGYCRENKVSIEKIQEFLRSIEI